MGICYECGSKTRQTIVRYSNEWWPTCQKQVPTVSDGVLGSRSRPDAQWLMVDRLSRPARGVQSWSRLPGLAPTAFLNLNVATRRFLVCHRNTRWELSLRMCHWLRNIPCGCERGTLIVDWRRTKLWPYHWSHSFYLSSFKRSIPQLLFSLNVLDYHVTVSHLLSA